MDDAAPTYESFVAVIEAWENAEVLAGDINTTGGNTRIWKQRDSIPSSYWEAVVAAAGKRGLAGITYELLARLAARKRRPPAEDAAA